MLNVAGAAAQREHVFVFGVFVAEAERGNDAVLVEAFERLADVRDRLLVRIRLVAQLVQTFAAERLASCAQQCVLCTC